MKKYNSIKYIFLIIFVPCSIFCSKNENPDYKELSRVALINRIHTLREIIIGGIENESPNLEKPTKLIESLKNGTDTLVTVKVIAPHLKNNKNYIEILKASYDLGHNIKFSLELMLINLQPELDNLEKELKKNIL